VGGAVSRRVPPTGPGSWARAGPYRETSGTWETRASGRRPVPVRGPPESGRRDARSGVGSAHSSGVAGVMPGAVQAGPREGADGASLIRGKETRPMPSHGDDAATRLTRIATRARQDPTATFDNLLSVITVEFWLPVSRLARARRRGGSMTWEYAQDLRAVGGADSADSRMGYHRCRCAVHIPKSQGTRRWAFRWRTSWCRRPTAARRCSGEPRLFLRVPSGRGRLRRCVPWVTPGSSAGQLRDRRDIRGFFDHVDHARLCWT
jgi:hypothetical protein